MEGKVTLSGYLINTFYTGPEMDAYGHVVNVASSFANIHHHMIHLKADLDIKGRKNRFQTLDISLEEVDVCNFLSVSTIHVFVVIPI